MNKHIHVKDKTYYEVELNTVGSELSHCFTCLQKSAKDNKILLCMNFNGKTILSDMTMDEAYISVVGKTKEEYDKEVKDWYDASQRELKEHKQNIPNLVLDYIEKGHKLLNPKYWKMWDECVPFRLNDLYRGLELDCALKIVEMLNNQTRFADIKKELENQGHSGCSYSLMKQMIKTFHDKGQVFINFLNKDNNYE